ncbi:Cytosolic iron-sulfur protein assembly protein [Trapelia coarctata]|nr:Cytosolic iron-sulfur protein assembly protein [Trapelia coarctata]
MPGTLTLLSPFTPPSLSRAWLSTPHPHLPIIASCSSDKSVRIYSLTSFTLLSTISGGHKRSVRSCAWKPGVKGESTLATGSFDASVGVWKRWDGDMLPKSGIGEMDYTDTGKQGGEDGDNDEEDEEWRYALVLDGHESEVKSVAWSAAGNFLATCSRDKSIWIWEEVGEDDFETVAVLQEHTADVKCVVWHPEEELLASGSYDDEIRLWKEEIDDWGCVSALKGHESTVWSLSWEGSVPRIWGMDVEGEIEAEWLERRQASGPRLISCSDDMTTRVWRRQPRERTGGQNPLSIIMSGGSEEEWVEEAKLPQRHERAIYAVAWSGKTGRVVTTGGDGRIMVYEERWRVETATVTNGHSNGIEPGAMDVEKDSTLAAEKNAEGTASKTPGDEDSSIPTETATSNEATEWVVIAEIEGSHGAFEVNHVCWARRADRNKRTEDVEVILSTGDDGVVKVWTLDV